MIETEICAILGQHKMYGSKDRILSEKYQIIVDNQNGVHPMNETFFLIGLIDEYNLGTATKTLTTREIVEGTDGEIGIWKVNQPKAYEVRISIQGDKSLNGRGDGVGDILELLKLQMDLPSMRRRFANAFTITHNEGEDDEWDEVVKGYSYEIDPQTITLPIKLNTDQYIRYSFKVTFKTNIAFDVEQEVMDGVKVEGKFIDDSKNVIEEYSETVDKNTIINSKG